ncbi:TPA: hypothetical protein QFT03_003104 [Kluyvera ascorbata]|uniref:Uncharacterized protein n=1 Tax=Kluyvera genomosp. 3 TaxID=2774055 RepID=A0A6G9RG17_9ENTR|nr:MULTISPECIES: hypothetical protein [Kluyvera]QIR25267.1 hypothetical protein GY169_13605 [Kluyvera genomosp. 3]UAK22812.1 hypothetical protein K7B04_15705 [Kluyvera sp. CRP]HDT6546116.1 hypothetical protein [Kluyvera ascorbata]
MEKEHNMPDRGYVIIRCDNSVIVARLASFASAIIYRSGDMISFMPLQPDEIVGTPSLFA